MTTSTTVRYVGVRRKKGRLHYHPLIFGVPSSIMEPPLLLHEREITPSPPFLGGFHLLLCLVEFIDSTYFLPAYEYGWHAEAAHGPCCYCRVLLLLSDGTRRLQLLLPLTRNQSITSRILLATLHVLLLSTLRNSTHQFTSIF